MTDQEKREIVEQLATLEHDQWIHWTSYMLDNLTPENIARWRRQINTPYEELSEREKESDRKWAHMALHIIRHFELQELLSELANSPIAFASPKFLELQVLRATVVEAKKLIGGRRE
jgi:hypothetical protein